MGKQPDYADRLRESLLALALVPIAGLDTASYWLRESLDRTTRFSAEVIGSTALARFTRSSVAQASGGSDPVADVLAQDLLDAARTYVRSMVRLPADSGIYFTGELERRLNALLEQIQPEVEQDLEGYADMELERILHEVDRLFVVVRAEAKRSASVTAPGPQATRRTKLVAAIDSLRTRVREARPDLSDTPRVVPTLEIPADPNLRAFNAQKARTKLLQTLREVRALVPHDQATVDGIEHLIGYLEAPSTYLPKEDA
jgi:hypothetical protein